MRHCGSCAKWLPVRLVVVWATIGLLVSGATTVEANPFARFLYSIRHRHHQPVASHRHKHAGKAASATDQETASVRSDTTEQKSAEPLGATTSGGTASSRATNETNRQLPIGISVPNKPGFVKSPYTHDQALIDVRGFPSGTRVKDPYTGKTFVTP